jgi:hypothetical protein
MGFMIARVEARAYSERYSEVNRQGGTARATPATVTQSVPAMNGQNPNWP